MSPVVRKPAFAPLSFRRRLTHPLLFLGLAALCASCLGVTSLFGGRETKLALSEGGDKAWTLLELDPERLDLGASPDLGLGPGVGILAMASRSRSLPEAWRRPAFKAAVEAWIRDGGRLFLLGYAAAYAEDLALAGSPRIGAYVFGRRGNRDARGYQYGLDLSESFARRNDLAREFLLGGGTHGRVEYCLFDREAQGSARVLGSYFRKTEGKREGRALAGLLQWQLGKGSVLALGLSPLATDEGRQLISALCAELSVDRKGAWLALPIIPPDPLIDRWVASKVASPLKALHEIPSGLVPRLAHYGLAAPLDLLQAKAFQGSMKLALDKGADLFLAKIRDREGLSQAGDLRLLSGLLHSRGALLALDLVDAPAGSIWSHGPESRVELRALMELDSAGSTLSGAEVGAKVGESLDGLGGRAMAEGYEMQHPQELWGYNPGAFLLGSDPEPVDSAASVGQIRPDAGRIRDLPVRGLIDPELSQVFPPRLFSLLHLDPDPAHGGYRDWLHAQVRDFLRNREEEASAVVLDIEQAEDSARLTSLLEALQRPFSSARSYRLSATGRGGQREALAELIAEESPGLRALSEAPSSRMIIENRFLRLEGTEGSLLVDRDRAADFSLGHDSWQRLSTRFMSTRLRGARPGPDYVVKVHEKLRPRLAETLSRAHAVLELPASGDLLPSSVSPLAPALVDKALQLSPGSYELRFLVRSKGRGSLVEVRLDDRVIGFLTCSGGQNKSQMFQFGIASERRAHLVLQHRYGEEMQLLQVEYEKVADAGIEARSKPDSGPRALVVEQMGSSFLSERRRILTLGDLPALCLEVDYDHVSTGLRVDRFFAFEGYRLARTERLERGKKVFFRIEDPEGAKPDLILIASGLGRNHELIFHAGEGLAMKSFPRSRGGFRLALILAEELGQRTFDPTELWSAMDEVVRPPKLKWEQGRRSIAWPWSFVWRRCAILPGRVERPIQVREGGMWRGLLPGPSGDQGASILVAGGPGDVSAVTLGEWVGPRPLPGAARLISFESETGSLVLSRLSTLCPRPGVLLQEALGAPSLDGRSWDYHYADRLWLPRRPGRYRVGLTGDLAFRPSLVSTTGNVEQCRYDEDSRELVLRLSDPRPRGGPAVDRLFALEIRGPRPSGIRGAVLADPGRASPQGRFRLLARPGEVRIRFGEAARPGR